MASKEKILEALKSIIDPDLGKDIVTLGFIKELIIHERTVSFSIELTTPACPMKNHFKEQAEKLVLALDGVEKVHVNMTAQNRSKPVKQEGLSKVGNIIAIASAKGGVGKSTVSATFASELASQGYKVGLLDIDLYGPSLPTLFNIHNPQVYQRGNMLLPMEVGNLKFMSFGFLFGDAPAVMRGPMVSGYLQQVLNQTNWGELDYLFVDMPPGTGDIQLTLSQSIQLDGAVIVTTHASLSVVDVVKGILMFEKVGVPMLGIVENMAYFLCDSCEKKHYIFGKESAHLTERFGLESLAQIPIEKKRGLTFDQYESNEINRGLAENMVRSLGKIKADMGAHPEVLSKEQGVEVKWEKGSGAINYITLRDNCKCALCVDEYTGEKILQKESIPKDIRVESIRPLGNYAVAVAWSDGHSSSIYPYTLLKELSG